MGFQGHVGGVQTLMINDLDLVRQVLVKDFDHFVDRWERVRYGNENLNYMMHVQTGERWKELRHAVAPVFTSGKLRHRRTVFDKSEEKVTNFCKFLLEHLFPSDIQLWIPNGNLCASFLNTN